MTPIFDLPPPPHQHTMLTKNRSKPKNVMTSKMCHAKSIFISFDHLTSSVSKLDDIKMGLKGKRHHLSTCFYLGEEKTTKQTCLKHTVQTKHLSNKYQIRMACTQFAKKLCKKTPKTGQNNEYKRCSRGRGSNSFSLLSTTLCSSNLATVSFTDQNRWNLLFVPFTIFFNTVVTYLWIRRL